MKDKEKNQKVEEQMTKDEQTQDNGDECSIDVEKLSEEQAKEMLSEVLNSNSEIIKELESVRSESLSFKDKWYRTTAEFENFKKRNQDLRRTAYDDGKIDAIKGLFVVGDSLDRALSMELDEKTKSGVELIQRQFVETMKSLGVEVVNPEKQVFSPDNAEAIAMVDAVEGEESGVIRSVFKKGYKLNGKTMRYAQVVVVK